MKSIFALLVVLGVGLNSYAEVDLLETGKPATEEMTLVDKSNNEVLHVEDPKNTVKCPVKKGKFEFKSVSLFDGNPRRKANLAPDNADSALPHKWTVGKGTRPWVVCNYGDKLSQLHHKKVKGKVKSCETLESKKGSGVFDSIGCR